MIAEAPRAENSIQRGLLGTKKLASTINSLLLIGGLPPGIPTSVKRNTRMDLVTSNTN